MWKSPAVKASKEYKKQHQILRDHWEKIKTIILPYLPGAFPGKVN